MRTNGIAVALTIVSVWLIIDGYRDGTTGGLLQMALGGLGMWYVVYSTVWSIPSIGDSMDAAREDGIGVPRDMREWDPDIVQDRHLHNLLNEHRRGRP